MHRYSHLDAGFTEAFNIAMASLNDSDGVAHEGIAWGKIPVGGETREHRHDELELFVILQGEGIISGDDRSLSIHAGEVIEFAPFERHVLQNTGEIDLIFLDIYWRNMRAVRDLTPSSATTDDPVFVFSTPPTPNGDLHLGHLAGPYLGADIYTRFLRMCGREAYHLTGTDDYQSYVESCAKAEQSTPERIAEQNGEKIAKTLSLLDCHIDQFTVTSKCDKYNDRIRSLFQKLIEAGGAKMKASEAVFDAETRAYLYEPYVSGRCPDCGAHTSGNICEECGAPNCCHDLLERRAYSVSGATVADRLERYEIDLAASREAVLSHLDSVQAPARIQELAHRVFSRSDTSFPVSHPSSWGVIAPGCDDQVVWVWPEMAFGFLIGIETLGRRLGRCWSCLDPSDDWEIVHFFGFDNSFYHAVLYPALYKSALSNWQFDIKYIVNEFYLLDGKKFSTSRRHAVWGQEVLSAHTVDALRLHLALTRPENARTNFSNTAFEATQHEIFEGKIQAWLAGIWANLETYFGCTMPDAGDWSQTQIAFFNRLRQFHGQFEKSMEADDFSARRAARILVELVADCDDFSNTHAWLLTTPGTLARARTKTALEFCAARLLASMAGPLMPRFAATLAADLRSNANEKWPDHVTLLAPGAALPKSDHLGFNQAE